MKSSQGEPAPKVEFAGAPAGDARGLVGVRAMSCQVEQHVGLAPYEIERAENIRRNNAFLLNLGLQADVHALRTKPKKPKAAPKPKPEPTGPRRSSGRLSGEAPEEPFGIEPAAADDQPDEPDPFFCWWTATEENPAGETRPPLTDEQKTALMTPLTAEQREAIVFPEGSASAMVQDAMVLLRSYVSGSQTLRLLAAGHSPPPMPAQGAGRVDGTGKQDGPRPSFGVLSRDNLKNVLDTVGCLAAGEGLTNSYRVCCCGTNCPEPSKVRRVCPSPRRHRVVPSTRASCTRPRATWPRRSSAARSGFRMSRTRATAGR